MSAKTFIRPAEPRDAETLARLANALDAHEGGSGQVYEAETILRDGFGARPHVSFLLAEQREQGVGYAMFCDFYNSDRGAPSLFMNDLYVVPEAQGRGIGRRLMAAVAAEAKRRKAISVWWGVYSRNQRARGFYASIGAEDDGARLIGVEGNALDALAKESEI